jgi:hypothetical protein
MERNTYTIPHRRDRSAMGPLIAVLASVLLVSFMVVSVSRAAFTASTDNTTNSLSTATLTLTDDDSGSVLFNVSNMVPGDTTTNCIAVTYSGTQADPLGVKLYSGGYTDSGTLANYLNITIEEGTGATFGSCGGFTLTNTIETGGTLSAFDTAHSSYATGAGVWDPSGTPETVAYRITFELDAATPDSQQGESVTALTFTWEVQSS